MPGRLVPGLIACVVLAALAMFLGGTAFAKDTLHAGELLIVIVLGMLARSTLPLPQSWAPGLVVARGAVLRWAVAGLGFKLSLSELAKIGGPSLAVILVSTTVAIAGGYWIAKRLGVNHQLAVLLGIGGGICGASAIVAADSVLKSEKGHVPCGLGIITLWGTVGILAYPWLGELLNLNSFAYGIWNGASLHEMAQVVAAGQSFGADAVAPSTVAKLARICLLAPVVVGLAWWMTRKHESHGEAKVAPVPWFLIVFLVFAVVNSFHVLSQDATALLLRADLWLLCIGMAGVGLQSGFQDVKREGWQPVVAGFLQWVLLAGLSLVLVRAFVA
ncbi:MAG: hypothetical protein HONBIEJF_02505 [Fimbriimonadaceae bacterium]|nr:hypothetical protein [Fimbriimonadaceae bacterium]